MVLRFLSSPGGGGRLLAAWRRELLDFLFPSSCPLCGAALPGGPPRPCRECLRRLQGPRPPLCLRCGFSLGPGAPRGGICRRCARRPWFRGLVAAPFFYGGAGGELVRALKFGGERGAGIFLGAAMTRAGRAAGLFREREGAPPLLVPVPLHRKKLRRRGRDQARFLAEEVGRRTGLSAVPLLARIRETRPQGDLRTYSRERNVAGAFAPGSPGRIRRARGARVILVDDVATSGATARECRRVLLRLGVLSVDLLAACRARLPSPPAAGGSFFSPDGS